MILEEAGPKTVCHREICVITIRCYRNGLMSGDYSRAHKGADRKDSFKDGGKSFVLDVWTGINCPKDFKSKAPVEWLPPWFPALFQTFAVPSKVEKNPDSINLFQQISR